MFLDVLIHCHIIEIIRLHIANTSRVEADNWVVVPLQRSVLQKHAESHVLYCHHIVHQIIRLQIANKSRVDAAICLVVPLQRSVLQKHAESPVAT